MSREHRLAIVAGFAVFLVVAVLISDHMSRARGVRLADGRTAESSLPVDLALEDPVTPLPEFTPPRTRASEPTPIEVASADAEQDAVEPLGGGLLSMAAAEDEIPLVIGNGPAATRIVSGDAGDTGSTADRLRGIADRLGVTIEELNPVVLAQRDAKGDAKGDAQGRGVPPLDPPAGPGGGTATPLEQVNEPAMYVVQAGDSLSKIARRFLGSERSWRQIAALNAGVVGEDGSVRVGDRIRLPASATPAKRVPDKAAKSDKPTDEPVISRAADEKKTRTYVVKRGDTLGEIARRQLGSSRRKGEIIELNRDKIRDEDSIRVGMTVRLPAK